MAGPAANIDYFWSPKDRDFAAQRRFVEAIFRVRTKYIEAHGRAGELKRRRRAGGVAGKEVLTCPLRPLSTAVRARFTFAP